MAKFRFEDLEIWKESIIVADKVFDISDTLEERKLFRFAEQLRDAGLSISNNIAEGSGSASDKDFANFLNISRRSVFETANILFVLSKRVLIDAVLKDEILSELHVLSAKITNLRKRLL